MISDSNANDEISAGFGPTHNSKRLIVDHIVLENFKSYAGRTSDWTIPSGINFK